MPAHPTSIDGLLGLTPTEGHPWIRLGALAHAKSLNSGVSISCPYADATEEAEYWHLGYVGAQFLRPNEDNTT